MRSSLKKILVFIFLFVFSSSFLRAADDTLSDTQKPISSKLKKPIEKAKHHSKKKKSKGKKGKDDTNPNAQDEVSDQNEVSQQSDSKTTKRK